MKTRFLIIFALAFCVPFMTQSTFAECSEHDREACLDEQGKFDYDEYWDSFWEPIEIQHSFEKNSTATFKHKKNSELGLRGTINATQEDVLTITVPRNVVDALYRDCNPDDLMLVAKYEKQYVNSTLNDGYYEDTIWPEQPANQTHRIVTFDVLPTMSFELVGAFPLGLIDEMFDTCGALNGYSTYYTPPKFQTENGVEPLDVKCNDGLVLIQKHDNSSACVTYGTGVKLVTRGWATCDNEVSHNRGHPCDPHSSGLIGFDSNKEVESIDELQSVLDSCNSTGIQPAIGYRYSNDTHYIDNNSCKWKTTK